MEEEKIVPNYALDLINAQHTTEKKRLWIAILILFLAFVGTNIYWINREYQYEDVTTTVSMDAISDSGDAIINGDKAGAVFYGESETDSNDKDTTQESGR